MSALLLPSLVLLTKASSLRFNDITPSPFRPDLSGNGNHLYGSPGRPPDFRYPDDARLSFNGAFGGQFLFTRPFARELKQSTVFVVAQQSGGVHPCLVDGIEGEKRNAIRFQQGWPTQAFAGVYLDGQPMTSEWNVVEARFAGSNSRVVVNGGTPVVGDAGDQPLSGVTLGARFDLLEFWNGGVKLLAVFEGVLTDDEADAITTELMTEYSITP